MSISIIPLDQRVALLMQGSEFGDEQLAEAMADELRTRLAEADAQGRPLRVYCGYDATKPDLHLGHTVTMRKLRQFQDLGHHVTFLIGDFTTRVGDPSDKNKLRPRLTEEEIAVNARTYAEQAGKVLDLSKTHVRYNSEWLSKLTLTDSLELSRNFTVQQFLVRDNFQARLERGEPIWLHEFSYALLQGYDAVALEADVQLGATEQLFNLLAGRKLQEAYGLRPQVCITFPILVGLDGRTRMSKSAGNYIGLAEPPEEIYGKVMSLPDEAMASYFRLVTRWSPEETARMESDLRSGALHPMEAKKKLAWEVVDTFHGPEGAAAGAAHFERVHQRGGLPEDMPEVRLGAPTTVLNLLVMSGMCGSRGEGRRLVLQGGVSLDGRTVDSPDFLVTPMEAVLQVGKRRFVRILP